MSLARERQLSLDPGPACPVIGVPSLHMFCGFGMISCSDVAVYFRQVRCPYARLGCQWAGQYHKLASHESACAHPHKTGAELMEQLRVLEEQRHEEVKLYKLILDFMSCEKVVITGMSRLSLCC